MAQHHKPEVQAAIAEARKHHKTKAQRRAEAEERAKFYAALTVERKRRRNSVKVAAKLDRVEGRTRLAA